MRPWLLCRPLDRRHPRHMHPARVPALAAALLLGALAGCGEAASRDTATPKAYDGPVERPTEVPPAAGTVTTSEPVIVTDDGSGPRLCFSNVTFDSGAGTYACRDATVTGWDWAAVDSEEVDGVRSGTYDLTGTFDGETFAVTEARPPSGDPAPYDFTIPCPEPDGGWRVVDPARTTRETYLAVTGHAQRLPGFAMAAVSTSAGEPAPRDPMDTVVSVYVAGDPEAAESELRRSWGGMLCVTQVERSAAELDDIQMRIVRLGLPGMTQVGGDRHHRMELEVFHDDGSIQRWADQEFGDGVVVVTSILQPAP